MERDGEKKEREMWIQSKREGEREGEGEGERQRQRWRHRKRDSPIVSSSFKHVGWMLKIESLGRERGSEN